MAAAERGSFQMMLFSLTQIWLALKLWDDVETWLTTLLGTTGAACIMVAIILFRQEQRQLLLNPLGTIQKEVHPDAIAKQGNGTWIGIGIWLITIFVGSFVL